MKLQKYAFVALPIVIALLIGSAMSPNRGKQRRSTLGAGSDVLQTQAAAGFIGVMPSAKTITYVRLYADSTGESHFEDLELELASADFAPPAPPLDVSAFVPARQYGFLSARPGWFGDWHPTPRRQIIFFLAGEIEVQVSDGEVRRFGPGSITLLEDTAGPGHTSRVLGSTDVLLAVVQLDN